MLSPRTAKQTWPWHGMNLLLASTFYRGVSITNITMETTILPIQLWHLSLRYCQSKTHAKILPSPDKTRWMLSKHSLSGCTMWFQSHTSCPCLKQKTRLLVVLLNSVTTTLTRPHLSTQTVPIFGSIVTLDGHYPVRSMFSSGTLAYRQSHSFCFSNIRSMRHLSRCALRILSLSTQQIR